MLAFVLALIACAPPGLAVGVPHLENPPAVTFDDARLGQDAYASTSLANVGAGAAHATLTVDDGPFAILTDDVDIAAGTTVPITVVYTPSDYEPVTGVLRVDTGRQVFDVPITASTDRDADDDGHAPAAAGGDDCDDDDADVHPGAPERDDGKDDDCDGLVDEDFLVYGDVLVDELLLDPEAVADDHGQFVELLATSRTVDLAGLSLQTSAGTVTLPSVVLGRGDVAVLCVDTDASTNGGVTCDAALPGPLAAEGHVALTSAVLLDAVDWTGWPVTPGASRILRSGARDPDENDDPASWCTATTDLGDGDLGTPGTSGGC